MGFCFIISSFFHSIHHLFVSFFTQGQIKPSKSLFTYKTGQSQLSFVNLDYRPMFIDNITWLNDDIRRKAVATCGNSTNCLYDAAVTSDMSYGASTKEVEEKNEKAKRESGESICPFFYLIIHSFIHSRIKGFVQGGQASLSEMSIVFCAVLYHVKTSFVLFCVSLRYIVLCCIIINYVTL